MARRSRTSLPGRRTRPIRRASAGLSAVRAGAALAMLVSAAAIYGVGASPAFEYRSLHLDGVTYTDPTAVRAALAVVTGKNLFQLVTRPLVVALERLPTVRTAHVDVLLPGALAVTIDERTPVVIWKIGTDRFLADADGTLFAALPASPPAGAASLPVIDDQRAVSVGVKVGYQLDAVDIDAATRFASLVPADVGSSAISLAVVVTDENGFILQTRPGSWTAIFGFYTPSLRTTAMIPGQVRLLRSLLAGREAQVDRVVLASETDGTYTPRGSPAASPVSSHTP